VLLVPNQLLRLYWVRDESIPKTNSIEKHSVIEIILRNDLVSPWDETSVGIVDRIFQAGFEALNDTLSDEVLDLFRVVVDMVAFVASGIGQVEFPETVIANDFTSPIPAFFG